MYRPIVAVALVGAACSGPALIDNPSSAPPAAPSAYSQDVPIADSMAGWYALGFGAHHLCAGMWVVGRDFERSPEQVVTEDIARFEAFGWGEDFEWSTDPATHTATVSDPVYGSRSARYNGDQGCTLLPAGATNVYFDPVALGSALPGAATVPWPMGDVGATADFDEVDKAKIEAAFDYAFTDTSHGAQNTRGLLVVYKGKIVGERYLEGWGPDTPQLSWSMGKSIASALTGVLIEQGEFALDDPAPIPEWHAAPHDPRASIRVRDLLQMSSGLDFDNFGLNGRGSLLTSNEHMRIYFDALDTYTHVVNQPARFPPGSVWRYRNTDPLGLMVIVKSTVEARGDEFLTFPRRALFDRLGMRSMVVETDPWGNLIMSGYDYGSTRDWARFGLLHLWDGMWEGERILPEGWSAFVSTPAPGDPTLGYGGLFWLNRGGAMNRIPQDAYWASGFMGQTTMVIPSRDMVIVRHGPSPAGFSAYFNEFVGRALDAVGEEAP